MQLQFTTLDVFTQSRYVGNPLAVIRVPASLRNELTEEQKQKIAREFNYSEITFLHEPAESEDVADFDIFTPSARMSFAGHPTIGTAVYVAQHKDAYPQINKLRTVAGLIPFAYDADTGRAAVAIPHDVHVHRARLAHPFPSNKANKSTVPIVSIVKGMAFGLAQLVDLDALGAVSTPLIPPADRYKREFLDAGSGWDVGYTGSFYYVDLGVDPDLPSSDSVRLLRTRSIPLHEDPGTGSASAALCCYIALSEGGKGLKKFHLTQGVEMGRRCDIFVAVRMREDGKGIEDVQLSGTAVEVMEGSLTVG
ncbi:phenazine biosynthesis protein-like protein phzf family [Cucurbitaria berberidis CBS 394.84]|uniref:Phenazine biosynthesis protein-like protein phzf family n=1 Tax=Cucurbitaria berberidis CBS 394.84 TaxID=1168544 RepID=A0A9P4GBP4_9PLEO|nr:phenazine biosynthesis protein-like protein phzf family [Cucurbitaria berberidis CBS 394.84]KAF1842564.1 phenazine biosynthesis protein-like protein phzf family [Cucurbitaria berberidis CBS 394.84]